MNILICRTGALGDVILTTPIVRWFGYHNPQSEIIVQTAYPMVFRDYENQRGFHNVRTISPESRTSGRLINLDLAFEYHYSHQFYCL